MLAYRELYPKLFGLPVELVGDDVLESLRGILTGILDGRL